jgi:hypothetical protein
MKLRALHLSTSLKLQLQFVLGMVLASPYLWLIYQLPPFNALPLWLAIAFAAFIAVAGMIWFRQCMSPDKTSFKPKWR